MLFKGPDTIISPIPVTFMWRLVRTDASIPACSVYSGNRLIDEPTLLQINTQSVSSLSPYEAPSSLCFLWRLIIMKSWRNREVSRKALRKLTVSHISSCQGLSTWFWQRAVDPLGDPVISVLRHYVISLGRGEDRMGLWLMLEEPKYLLSAFSLWWVGAADSGR